MSWYLTVSQAAEILGVHPNTLRRWEKTKKLVPIRNKSTGYRYYTPEQIGEFIRRGKLAQIEIKWGYQAAIKAREEEISSARRSVEAVVSYETTTYEPQVDLKLMKLLKQAVDRGVQVRFIRNLKSPLMVQRASKMAKLGVQTRNLPIAGLTFSIRDRKIVRIEIYHGDIYNRLNIIIRDAKVARSFGLLFEKLWEDAEQMPVRAI